MAGMVRTQAWVRLDSQGENSAAVRDEKGPPVTPRC